MSTSDSPAEGLASDLDDFVSSRAALILAFIWGLAEATFFFFVPDLLLTLLACRAVRPALKATLAALAGALFGGAIMYAFGKFATDATRSFLDYIPAINPALIDRVQSQMTENGLVAVLTGPLRGIPYKIYAVEWGARGWSFISLLLISVPARYIRFFAASMAASALTRALRPFTGHRAAIELSILTIVWIAFYSFYFFRFGW